jgi:hypothetical protein
MKVEKYISNNSYRVLGVPSNSSLKDIQKNISKLKAFAKIGKEMQLDYDLSCLNFSKINRTDDLLLKSENQIKLDKNRIQMSLFWFVDISPIDTVSLANLIKGDVSKSIEIWEKATKSNELTLNNYSAFNNLSTLLLLSSLDDSNTDTFKKDSDSIKIIKQAIHLKNKFISSTFFNNYCESICKSASITSDDAQEFFTNTILELFQKNFTAKDLSYLFEGLDDQLKDTLNATLTDTPLSNIQNHIDNAADLIKKNEKSGVKVGKQLIKDTLADFKKLKEILGVDDFQFQTISDSLANQILQCGIVCFNSTSNDQEYLSSYKYALKIAVGDQTITRAKKTIKHCEEERKSRICSGCDNGTVNNQNKIYIQLYKETNRTWFPRRVQYQSLKLTLLFCDKCYNDLNDKQSLRNKIKFGTAAAAGFIGLLSAGFGGLIFGGLFGLFWGWVATFIFVSGNNYTKNHPVYRKYINEGWSESEPTA